MGLKGLKQSERRTFIYLDLDLKPWSKLAFTVRATQSVPQFESFQKSSSVVRYSYIIALMASLKKVMFSISVQKGSKAGCALN